jgi:hypothetical protein
MALSRPAEELTAVDPSVLLLPSEHFEVKSQIGWVVVAVRAEETTR